MKTRHLVVMAAVTLAVLVVFNAAVWRLAAKSPAHSLAARLNAEKRVDLLFVGDSTVDSAVDAGKFSQAWTRQTGQPVAAFNAALRASSPVEHYLAAREALRVKPGIKWLVTGFWNLQLTDIPSAHWTNLVGNRALGYRLEPALAAELYAPGSAWAKWRFRLLGWVPAVSERLTLWAKVESLRRRCGNLGLPHARTTEMGRVADLEAAVEPFVSSFVQRCEAAVHQQSPLLEASARLLREAGGRRIRAVVVSMPMNDRHHRLFYSSPAWRAYHGHIRALVEREGTVFVDASGWVTEYEFFTDTRHLNKVGAARFSERLAAHLAALPPPHDSAGK